MSKYFLKVEFIDSIITTKTSDGTEIVITKNDFNDSFAEMLIANGQDHLVRINPNYESIVSEKKTFVQVTDTHILLTSKPLQTEELEPLKTVEKQTLKPNGGKRPRVKK